MKTIYYIITASLLFILTACGEDDKKQTEKSILKHKVNSGKETIVKIKNTFENEELDTSSVIEKLQKQAEDYSIKPVNYSKYVTAENGLLYRDAPGGKKQQKFSFATKIEVVAETNKEMAVTDKGGEIIGKWVAVKKDEFSEEIVFVFDGFLGDLEDIDREKVIKKSPITFEKVSQRGIILPGTHTIYNKKLKKVSQLTVDKIGSVYVVEKTMYKRPEQKGKEYCDWANYVEVVYGRDKFILFGKNILKVLHSKEAKFANREIDFLVAKNYTTSANDESGKTFCNDFNDIIIKEKNNYQYLQHQPFDGEENKGKKVLMDDGSISEKISQVQIENDAIIIQVNQDFQGSMSTYQLNVFENNGWKFTQSATQNK